MGVALTGDRKSTVELFWTLQLIHSIGAKFALPAHTGYPFDPNPVTLFPQLFNIIGDCHHDAGPFVAQDALGALLNLEAPGCPLIVEESFIGSTQTTVVDLAEDLAGCGEWDIDGGDLTCRGLALAYSYAGLLLGW